MDRVALQSIKFSDLMLSDSLTYSTNVPNSSMPQIPNIQHCKPRNEVKNAYYPQPVAKILQGYYHTSNIRSNPVLARIP